MKVRFASVPAQRAAWNARIAPRLGAFGQVAMIATALAMAGGAPVLAQTPAPTAPKGPAAAPKAAPKAGAPQTPGATAAAPAQPELPPITYTPWTKVCVKNPDANNQQFCFTGKDGRLDNGTVAVGATLIEPEGAPEKVLRVTMPLGVQLQPGTRLIVDQGQPLTAQFKLCHPGGCVAEYEVSGELLGKLRKGQTMLVQGIMGQLVSLPLPLSDFGKAYDGPPTDVKTYEERQKKLQEELQKKWEAMQQQQQTQAPK